jgi:hypothetical protein
MSGPFILATFGGALNEGALNEVELNGIGGQAALYVPLVDDELIFDWYVDGRLGGTTILRPGRNANTDTVPHNTGALVPTPQKREPVK